MNTARSLLALLVALICSSTLIAQSTPPDPANPNVAEVTISSDGVGTLEVDKTHTVPVTEIWKYVGGTWEKVWSTSTGGPFNVQGQSTKKSEIQRSVGGKRPDFPAGCTYRIVIQPTDESGSSTTIEAITEKP